MQQMLLMKRNGPRLAATYAPYSITGNANAMFNTDGSLVTLADGVNTTQARAWLETSPDTPTAALYEIRRTEVSSTAGVTFTGTMTSATWYPLTALRGVTVTWAVSVTRSNVSTWDIRFAGGDGTILATSSITVTADGI